ncbi:MAG TPA: DUF4118 domain-containing protein [Bryobacteraceae bacterium]|nr:DUF4118 domain-containing protein [Bryobacteraceae bacterium]
MVVRITRYLAALAVVIVITAATRHFGLNSTTVALLFLLIVLAAATFWGLGVAIAASLAALLAFNYFFLPPLGTFAVEDPQNWIALFAFLITAATASQLSARAQRRAAEAQQRGLETERLYELGRAILLNQQFNHVLEQTAADIARIFDIPQVAFLDSATRTVYQGGAEPFQEPELASVMKTGNAHRDGSMAVTPVRLGGKSIGSMGLRGRTPMNETLVEAIANLAAISVERARAIERASKAEAARRGEELRATLLDALAHDLKTPLTAIKAAISSLITSPPRSSEGEQELLTIISEETDRLNQTVSEAVQMARVDAAKISLVSSRCRVAELLENSLAAIRSPDLARRIAVHVAPSLPEVEVDADLIRQVLAQLIGNAEKYSIADGCIEIAAVEEGDSVVLSVADRGPGVTLEEQSRIFEKFYRGPHSKSVEGTGMGLCIARAIVEAHGGRIWVVTNHWGGATFLFRVRKARSAATA